MYGHQRRQAALLDQWHADGRGNADTLKRCCLLGRKFDEVVVDDKRQARSKVLDGEPAEIGKAVIADNTGGSLRAPITPDREVILVDDVIHTGRTVKSALSIIFRSGRPRSVRLAVLVDRGHREVPVKPNYVGKNIPSSEKDRVRVKLRGMEQEESDQVVIYTMNTPVTSSQLSAASEVKNSLN